MNKIDASLSRRHLLGAALTAPAWLQAGLAQAASPAPAVDPAELSKVTLRIGTY